MTENELFTQSDQALFNVIKQVKPEQLGLKLPEWFPLGRTQDRDKVDLRQLLNYHAFDEAWVPDTLAGKTIEEVGSKYEGDLIGDDPAAAYKKYMDLALAAVQTANLDNMIHLSYGDWSARDYLQHSSSFRLFRAFDIAKLIGADTKLPDELVQGAWDIYSPHFDEWQSMGVFGQTVAVSSDAPLQEKLIAASGRQPN